MVARGTKPEFLEILTSYEKQIHKAKDGVLEIAEP